MTYGSLVQFKSDPFFYYKEKSGLKPNTFRKIEYHDARFDSLIDMMQKREFGKIQVFNSEDDNIFFIREITDVTYYQGFLIISWEHKDE